MARLRLDGIDAWTLAYAGVVTAVLITRWPLPTPGAGLLPIAHAALLLLALSAARRRHTTGAALWALLADFYPLLLTSILYTEVGLLNALAGQSHDALVQGWESFVFGAQPSRDWIRACPWTWLSWPFHLGYLSYYILVPGPALVLWLRGRRPEARRVILLVAATFFVCYTVFLLFPVAGPRYTFPLATNAATAIAPAVFAQRLLNAGAAWGTAFPSSHVAVALVSTIRGGISSRSLGLVFVPLALLLTLGTVYGQFHYGVDALGGALMAAIVLLVDRRLGMPREQPAETGARAVR